jgi:ketosteroid isomerase-like protein
VNSRESNVEIVRAGLDAWNRRDVPAVLQILDPDAELLPMRAVLEGAVYRGPEGFQAFLEDMREDWEQFRLEPDDFQAVDDSRVLVLGRVIGRGRASGMDVEAPAAWLCELRAGKVTRVQFYTNQEAASEDLRLD